jgi:ribosomal protein S27AE
MNKRRVEYYCQECGYKYYSSFEQAVETFKPTCPKCDTWLYETREVRCSCGTWLPLSTSSSATECFKCGSLFNALGQSLRPAREWDPEEVYDAFGPEDPS